MLSNTFVAAGLLCASLVSALPAEISKRGINCHGSGLCPSSTDNWWATQLANYVNRLDDNAWVNNGVQIACNVNVCAFLQNTGGAPGHSVKALAWDIVNHGCKACGSVPLFWPSDNNDGDHGILTFNYVSNPRCSQGLC